MAVKHGLLLVVWGGSFSPDQVKVLCMWFQTSCTPSHNGIRAPGLGLKEGAVAPAWTGHSRRRQQRSMYVHNLALHSCTHDRSRSIRVSTSTAAARHSRSSNRRLRSTCTLFCTISSRQQEPFAERPRLIRWPTSCATTAHMKKHPPSDVHRWRVHVELWKALSDTLYKRKPGLPYIPVPAMAGDKRQLGIMPADPRRGTCKRRASHGEP